MKRQILAILGIIIVVTFSVLGITSEIVAIQVGTIAVLSSNALGLVAGMIVTHALKFPRDGSYRYDATIGKNKK